MIVSIAYYFGTKKKFNVWGKLAVNYEYLKFKYLYEGLTSLKDIRISENEEYFSKNYSNNVSKHGKITLIRNFIKILPKQTYEIIAVLSLVILSLSLMSRGGDMVVSCPQLEFLLLQHLKYYPQKQIVVSFSKYAISLSRIKNFAKELDEIYNSKKDTNSK